MHEKNEYKRRAVFLVIYLHLYQYFWRSTGMDASKTHNRVISSGENRLELAYFMIKQFDQLIENYLVDEYNIRMRYSGVSSTKIWPHQLWTRQLG